MGRTDWLVSLRYSLPDLFTYNFIILFIYTAFIFIQDLTGHLPRFSIHFSAFKCVKLSHFFFEFFWTSPRKFERIFKLKERYRKGRTVQHRRNTMQRVMPETSIKETYKVQQASKEKARQDSILAELGLNYEEIFSVPCVQFGMDAQADMAKICEKITDNIIKAHISVGMPETVAEKIRPHIQNSLNPYAGLSEAVKAYGLKKFPEIPADFFGKGPTGPAAKAVVTVPVKLK